MIGYGAERCGKDRQRGLVRQIDYACGRALPKKCRAYIFGNVHCLTGFVDKPFAFSVNINIHEVPGMNISKMTFSSCFLCHQFTKLKCFNLLNRVSNIASDPVFALKFKKLQFLLMIRRFFPITRILLILKLELRLQIVVFLASVHIFIYDMGIKYLKSPTVFIFSRRKEIEDDFELLFNLFLVLSYIFKIYLCGGRRFQVRAEISTRQRNSSSRPRQLIYTYFPRVIMIFSFSIIQ